MRPRPPRSTLFPYTTLFRSGRVTQLARSLAEHLANEGRELRPLALADERIPDELRELDVGFHHVPVAKFRSEEHTSELQSRRDLVCRLLLEKKKKTTRWTHS